MNENTSHTLRGPENEEEWRVYHAIRRKALFESRGRFGAYNENHPDEFERDNHPLILFDRDTPIGVIRVDMLFDAPGLLAEGAPMAALRCG